MGAREQGELVDRLMARITELESKLYDNELRDPNQFTIPAIHAAPPSPHTAAATAATQLASSLDRQLLDSLGDPEKTAAAQQQSLGSRDWRAAASSWLATSPLARSALGSLTATTTATATASAGPSTSAPAAGSSQHAPSEQQHSYAAKAAAAAARSSADSDCSIASSGWSLSSHQQQPPPTATAAARSPRASASTLPAIYSSSGPSFSFQQAGSQHAVLQAQPSTAGITSAASESSISPQHRHRKTNSDSSKAGGWSGLKSYYRYIMPSAQEDEERLAGLTAADVQIVQEAAGAALAEANERLLEAELRVQAALAAQRQLQQRLDAAEQLQEDIEQLKTENLEAWRQRYELESQLATVRASMDGMQGQACSMQKEMEDLREQAKIWSDSHHSEGDKLKAEVELLSGQLLQRSGELSSIREQLTEARAERDRALQEKQQALEERDRILQQLQQVSSLQQQLAAATAAAATSAASAAEFQEKFIRERAIRWRLHEQLQVLRGNIRVMCRVRPPLPKSPLKGQASNSSGSSGSSGSSSCITVPLEGLLCINDASSARQREFEFDACFGPEATQQQVFEEVSPLVRSCADGYNVCIFAYGQTGSGKTHTMEGPPDNPGINSRALQELFKIAGEEGEGRSPWSFTVSMMEIYNETVRDLLASAAAPAGSGGSGGGSGGSPSSSSNGGFGGSGSPPAGSAHGVLSSSLDVTGLPAGELPPHIDRVPGLVSREVRCAADVTSVLREGWRARATAATALNAASSRSHAVLCVKVRGARDGQPFTSLLYLVDLAGSERVDKSEVAGQQLKEAQAINKSLSSLGDVIAALQRRSAHIPFRNSKLTQVLQDSLCGSSKVLLVCNLSPEAASCGESLSSLNFASRAAQVELGQARRATGTTAAGAGTGAAADSAGPSISPEPSSSSIRGAASPGSSADARGGMRPKSPVFAGSSSGPAAAAGSGARPVSRLSDRASGAGPGLGSAGNAASPRVSMAKPARH